jgi:hypothetical protein
MEKRSESVVRKGAFGGADCAAWRTGVAADNTRDNVAVKVNKRLLRLKLENGIFLIPCFE